MLRSVEETERRLKVWRSSCGFSLRALGKRNLSEVLVAQETRSKKREVEIVNDFALIR
jgi:hypothetical protein